MLAGLNNLIERNADSKIISAHCHIKGLGCSNNLKDQIPISNEGDGFIGQVSARKAALIFHSIVKEGKLSGRILIISGKSGTGKTALAHGIARSLGSDVPFTHLSASEIFSLNFSKIEALQQGLRKSVAVKIKEECEVIEGEVVELIIETTSDRQNFAKITLKTKDMESLYNLGPNLTKSFEKENITAGDIIRIHKSTRKIYKLGRSIMKQMEYDTAQTKTNYMNTPSGELQKTIEVNHCVTFHETDVINSRTYGFTALLAGETGEIPLEVRNQVNDKMSEWKAEGKATFVPGVLFIDECHFLDIECYSFLNKELETETAPLLILATNRGVCKIRGTNELGPYGIPFDFLDRALVVPTFPYNQMEIQKILNERIKVENTSVSEDGLMLLGKIAEDESLRYAIQLITVADIIRNREKKASIELEHIRKVYDLFENVQKKNFITPG